MSNEICELGDEDRWLNSPEAISEMAEYVVRKVREQENRKKSQKVTAPLAREIKQMRRSGLYQHQIAAQFGINQGRVSEVLTGKRFSWIEI